MTQLLMKTSSMEVSLAHEAFKFLNRQQPHMLQSLLHCFTPQSASYFLLNSQNDKYLTLKFLTWARPSPFFNFQCKCHALHVITNFKLYKTAQSIAEDLIREASSKNNGDEAASFIFHYLNDSYHAFHSSSAVFDLMVKTYSSLRMVDSAVSTIRLSKEHGFMPGVLSYNSVLDAMIKSRGTPISSAVELFDEMRGIEASPNVFTYNIMIRGWCVAGELNQAQKLLIEMERAGCLPTVVTYNTMMDAYSKAGKTIDAVSLLKSMKSKHIQPSSISYNVIVNGLCREGCMKEATEMVDEMKQKGLLPDEVTYNTIIHGFCKEGDLHQALVLHAEMVRNGLPPDVVTYTALINGMCKAGMLKRAVEFFDQMCSRGIQPNEKTYTTLIDGFCQQAFMDEAYQFLKEMVEQQGFSPSVVTYNALINGYCVLGRMEEALRLIQEMVEKGLAPDVVSYSTILSGFCKKLDVDRAFSIKLEMVDRGIFPDTISYSALIQGLCQQKRIVEACDLFKEMLRIGLVPDEFTYTLLIDGHCKEGDVRRALQLHHEMIKKGLLPDIVTYSVLINGLNKQTRSREAKKLLLKLYCEESSVSHDITYSDLIENCTDVEFKSSVALMKGFCMKGLMNEARRVFKSMLQKEDYKPTGAEYDVLIHGYSKARILHRAYELYSEMVALGFVPHAATVISLIKGLYREEMGEELSVVIENVLKSCKLGGDAEVAKLLVDINNKEGNMDVVLNVLSEMAVDGLLPNSTRSS